jgi:HSP20 family protein
MLLGLPLRPAEFFRTNPFSLMRRMTEELDRAFSEPAGGEQSERTWVPAIEVTQRDGNFVVRAELPGLRTEDVKVEITDGALVIEGERKVEHDKTKGGIHVTERRYGKFLRAIPLPDSAKVDEARAKYENGVLEVTLPAEDERSKRREIPIQASSSAPAGAPSQKSEGSTDGAD